MARRSPARYKTGPKKGQFKPRGNPRAASAGRAKRGATKTRGRTTLAKARAPRARTRRRARQNPVFKMNALVSTAAASLGVVLYGQFVTPYVVGKWGANTAEWVSVAAVGGTGLWLTMAKGGKWAKTRPAGYALLGVALTSLFAKLAVQVKAMTETAGSPFVPRSSVVQQLPRRVSVPQYNPVARVVVPN